MGRATSPAHSCEELGKRTSPRSRATAFAMTRSSDRAVAGRAVDGPPSTVPVKTRIPAGAGISCASVGVSRVRQGQPGGLPVLRLLQRVAHRGRNASSWRRSARSCRCSSATSSASRRRRSRPIRRTCARGCSRTTAVCAREIEAFGGTVEKFIGDAVMAVFGAPVAHEDDAERAVRAGLRILEAIGSSTTPIRAFGSASASGSTRARSWSRSAERREGEAAVLGDAVNTAARIQTAAPIDGVAVGEGTFRATERVFEYEPLEPVSAKGKARAGASVAGARSASPLRLGRDPLDDHAAGRSRDRPAPAPRHVRQVSPRALGAARHRGRRAGVGQEPARRRAVCVHRRAHRSDHVAAGSLPAVRRRDHLLGAGGDPEGACRHLRVGSARRGGAQARSRAARGGGAPWLRARLLPLLGIDSGEAATQEEAFTAWRRLFESIAERDPTVLVFEDLHWADEALLAFLEHLADWAHGVPLLVVCTTRPELYESHASWGAGLRNATTISLSPLSEPETAQLIAGLLDQAVLPAETQQLILDRAGGNPLYAEEFVRMLRDRELLDARGTSADRCGGPVPRLDPGADRRAPRHALRRSQEPAAGRGGDRQGVLGGRDLRDGEAGRRGRRPRSARARAQGARPSVAAVVDAG